MILDKARELGRMIGHNEDYRALRRAEQELEGAPELQEKVERLQKVAEGVENGVVEGKEPSRELQQEYEALLGEIQSDSRYQRWVAAQANFEKLMLRVHEQIADGMQKAAESPIITLG